MVKAQLVPLQREVSNCPETGEQAQSQPGPPCLCSLSVPPVSWQHLIPGPALSRHSPYLLADCATHCLLYWNTWPQLIISSFRRPCENLPSASTQRYCLNFAQSDSCTPGWIQPRNQKDPGAVSFPQRQVTPTLPWVLQRGELAKAPLIELCRKMQSGPAEISTVMWQVCRPIHKVGCWHSWIFLAPIGTYWSSENRCGWRNEHVTKALLHLRWLRSVGQTECPSPNSQGW